ncbi:MAG: hypothetical protein HON47_02425 [Candidatus Diapherotrites archaeon]|jgi:hypothetical protein|uniref:DUF2207 domain-containing protein n=1 Tax=Candidatus Iainarchaeum sp. TaxID=3101447 RepID=A0A8T5GEF4_9ARCH|nr:hypothetical protein [Candidatus Diapherotrites archaeon]MBT7240858.1 hypothetical protein [Candidatus Diapherotrites archaeon]
MQTDKDKSIIQIMQKMVRDNEPEEKIVQTLRSLGVSDKQAKRLLLIAQADTFTLLGSEINKIVKETVSAEKEKMQADSQRFINKLLKNEKVLVKEDITKEFLKHKLALSTQQEKFQGSVNESVSKVAKLNEDVYNSSMENKKMIDQMKKDLEETKLKGFRARQSAIRGVMLIFGIALFIISAITLIMTILTDFNVDYVTTGIALAFVGIVVVYFSTNL